MTVKSNRINTSVSFAFSNIAENSLEVKQWDLLSFTSDGFVTKATPDSIIMWIANDKFSFPENNQTVEQWRVDYNPVIRENTYKMEVSWDISAVKVWFFYTMDANQKLDVSSASPSVWQFMVQDIYASCVDVRFVCSQWLAVPQYEDTKLESIEPTNPDSQPFDWQYTFTLTDWTTIAWDFSDLAWYLWDVEITGKLTVDQDLQVAGNSLLEWDLEVSWDTVVDMLTAADTNVTSLTNSWNSTIAGNETITGTLTAGATTVNSLESEWDAHIEWALIADWNTELGWTLEVDWATTIWWNTSITGTVSTTWAASFWWNTSVTWTITSTGNITWAKVTGTSAEINWAMSVTGIAQFWNKVEVTGNIETDSNINADWNLQLGGSWHISHALDVDWDLNVDGSSHLVWGLTSDWVTTINWTLVLWNNATASQFVLKSQNNQPLWYAGLDSDWKINSSVLPTGIYPNFYYETTTQGSTSYTLQHTPLSDSSIVIFTDSWTTLFPTIDYTCANWQITFTTMWEEEYAIIRVVSAE